MSNITVTELQGHTSGGDANKVKIKTGHELEVVNGDLTVDTDTLFVDSSNNRVSIGTVSPDSNHELEVATTSTAEVGIRSGNTSEAILNFGRTSDRLRGRIAYNNSSEYMSFWTNQGEKMRINNSGAVTMPNQPSFMAYRYPSVNQSNYWVGANSVDHNVGTHWNSSNGRFTAPVAGKYYVGFGTLTNAGNGRLELELHKNGSLLLRANESTGPSNYGGAFTSAIVNLAAADYLQVYLSAGTMYNSHQNNVFSVRLMG